MCLISTFQKGSITSTSSIIKKGINHMDALDLSVGQKRGRLLADLEDEQPKKKLIAIIEVILHISDLFQNKVLIIACFVWGSVYSSVVDLEGTYLPCAILFSFLPSFFRRVATFHLLLAATDLYG
ncbi:hypothetical protein ACJX0J_023937 [Zea mays]